MGSAVRKAAVVGREPDRDRFEVPEAFQLPDLEALLPTGGRWESTELELVNTYLDTPSAHLAQFGVTLVRREGVEDAGWHLAATGVDVRLALADATGTGLPEALATLVVGVRGGEEVAPVAQVTVGRTVHRLLGADGSVSVEMVEHRKRGTTLGERARLSSWREVVVEPGVGGGRRLQERVVDQLLAAGARPAESTPELARTLGFPSRARTAPDGSTVGGLAWRYVADQCREIVRCDIGLRRDEPLVHRFRVAIRRLRSTLRVFEPLFDTEAAAILEAELVWFAGLMGEVRDRDILLDRLAAQVEQLPPEVVLGPVAAHIETTLLQERSEHRARVTEAMAGERYQTLMQQVLRWQTRPPLTPRAGRDVADAARYLRRAEKKVDRRLTGAGGDVEALHGARKAAKRYRYAAELTAQAGAKRASRIIRSTTDLQTLLGEHQDSVVSASFLRRLGAESVAADGQNGFTYGFLMAEELRRAEQIRARAAKRWGRKSR